MSDIHSRVRAASTSLDPSRRPAGALSLDEGTLSLPACDDPQVARHVRVVGVAMAQRVLDRHGGHRERRADVAFIRPSDGGLCVECFDGAGEHLGDIAYRVHREGLFIAG